MLKDERSVYESRIQGYQDNLDDVTREKDEIEAQLKQWVNLVMFKLKCYVCQAQSLYLKREIFVCLKLDLHLLRGFGTDLGESYINEKGMSRRNIWWGSFFEKLKTVAMGMKEPSKSILNLNSKSSDHNETCYSALRNQAQFIIGYVNRNIPLRWLAI